MYTQLYVATLKYASAASEGARLPNASLSLPPTKKGYASLSSTERRNAARWRAHSRSDTRRTAHPAPSTCRCFQRAGPASQRRSATAIACTKCAGPSTSIARRRAGPARSPTTPAIANRALPIYRR